MAMFDNSTANILADDVLVEIFSYLDGDELLDLQTVCRRWYGVINSLVNWKKVLKRKIRYCPVWRELCKSLLNIAPELPSSCITLYRIMHNKIQKLNENWRSGEFFERTIQIDGEKCDAADDDFLVNFQDGNAVVYDRRKLEIVHKISGNFDYSTVKSNLIFLAENRHRYSIFDARNGSKIMELDELGYIQQVEVKHGLLIVISLVGYSDSSLQVWQEKAAGFELQYQRSFVGFTIRVDMDKEYLALYTMGSGHTYQNSCSRYMDVFFLSNFRTERSLGVRVRATTFHYDQGIFFLIHQSGRVQLLEVSTGKWLRTLNQPPWKSFFDASESLHWKPIATNSKCMATVSNEFLRHAVHSTVRIYDLVAARDPSAHSDCLLLFTIQIPGFRLSDFRMNEREMSAFGENRSAERQFFRSYDFLGPAVGREVITSITKRGRVVRRPARYGQLKSC